MSIMGKANFVGINRILLHTPSFAKPNSHSHPLPYTEFPVTPLALNRKGGHTPAKVLPKPRSHLTEFHFTPDRILFHTVCHYSLIFQRLNTFETAPLYCIVLFLYFYKQTEQIQEPTTWEKLLLTRSPGVWK